jgi:hypothetical protein
MGRLVGGNGMAPGVLAAFLGLTVLAVFVNYSASGDDPVPSPQNPDLALVVNLRFPLR